MAALRAAIFGAITIALVACGQAVGEGGPWMPWDSRPEAELAPPPAPPAPSDRLRVVTYNIHYGDDLDLQAAEFLADADLALADVILVQEIEKYPDEATSRASRLAAALGMGYVYVPARGVDDGGTQGLAIFSRFPLANAQVRDLPFIDLPVIDYPRIAVGAELEMAGGVSLRLLDLHLDTRLNVSDRLVQLRSAVIDAPMLTVAGGDLNTIPYVWEEGAIPLTPISAVAPIDQAAIVDDFMGVLGFEAPTAGLGSTQSSTELLQELRLDSIYSRGLRPTPGKVERGVGHSDHWPVWIDVALPQ